MKKIISILIQGMLFGLMTGCKDLNTDFFVRKSTVYLPSYECHNPNHSHYRDRDVILNTHGKLIPLQED